MAELARVTKTALDVSSEAEVLSYTYSGILPKEVYARVDMGDGTAPIVGNGIYTLKVYLNTVLVVPVSDLIVPTATTRAIAVSRQVMIDSGDVVSITLKGLGGDTAINTVSSLRDATPARAEEIYGIGPVMVDHNYPALGNLSYIVDGAGVDNACIYCYLKSNYDAGNRGSAFIVARSTTNVTGGWEKPMMLDPATYTFVFFKQGIYGPDTKEVTVV